MKTCPFCAEDILDAAIVCKHCRRDLTPKPAPAPQPIQQGEPKYQPLFARFDANGGGFTATWNWAALFFGPIWYLVKGMFLKSIVMILIAVFTAGAAAPFLWIYAGIAGNYDLYLLQRKQTQLWK